MKKTLLAVSTVVALSELASAQKWIAPKTPWGEPDLQEVASPKGRGRLLTREYVIEMAAACGGVGHGIAYVSEREGG